MHNCAKCGREVSSLEEINSGCSACGSKVFVFDRQAAAAAAVAEQVAAQEEAQKQETATLEQPLQASFPEAQDAQEGNGKAPESYHARTTFTDEDVENIKVLTQGVFVLDVNAISKNPVVLKDEDDVYYVKLPLEQRRLKMENNGGNGKIE